MLIANVLIQYGAYQLDKTFSYYVNDLDVIVGTRVFVTFNNRKIVGYVMSIEEVSNDKEAYESSLGYKLLDILSVVDDEVILNDELLKLAYHMQRTTISPLISCLSVMLPSKLRPSSTFQKAKKDIFVNVVDNNTETLTPLQQEGYDYIKDNQPLKQRDFNKVFKNGLINRLEAKGVVVKIIEESRYEEKILNVNKPKVLTKDQQHVYDEILNTDHRVYLLHGVTGSGKTEVYLQLAQQAIDKGQSVMILVPEISLTPQMINHVKGRFGDSVAIYHSYLNNQEKYEQYQRVVENKVKLTVGTRSSIFMPFDNIGLIILDEEHDKSYKENAMPRYHARDIAIYRAQYHNAKVILGSATPSLESYAKAYKKNYHLLELPNKIGKHQKIPYKIIDTQKTLYSGQSSILTTQLLDAIHDRLSKKEQVVLLLNRRGFTPVFTCKECFEVKQCKNCDIALSYHRDDNIMVCHVCGLVEKLPVTCDKCQSSEFSYTGYGTQKVEHELNRLFPKAHVVRMDTDQVSKKGSHERLLNEFESKGDILLGTQMIAKGLDYHRVTLVGVLNADSMLARNSFRTTEDTFNLINQVSGRGGRGELSSELLVQSFDAKHYAIVLACENDYTRFFNLEMNYRHLANYPPYTYLIKILLSSNNEELLSEKTMILNNWLKEQSFDTLGPSNLIKLKGQYRNQFVLKSSNLDAMIDEYTLVHDKFKKHIGTVSILVDVNPMEME